MNIATLILLMTALAWPAFASAVGDRCGTSAETLERAAAVEQWAATQPRSKTVAATGSAPGRLHDGILMLPRTERNSPFHHPFDLGGRSLRFVRRDSETFSVTNEALSFDANWGPARPVFTGDAVPLTLPFEFPFFGLRLKQLFVSPFYGISGSRPPIVSFDQYGSIELAAEPLPTIAPLLTTKSVIGDAGATIYIRTADDRAVITWTLHRGPTSAEVQATLFANGDIVCSYARVAGVPSGAVLLTPGRTTLTEEAVQLALGTDGAGDVSNAVPEQLAGGLDIQAVSLIESQNVGMVEIRISLGARPSVSGLEARDFIRYDVLIGGAAPSRVSYLLFGDGSEQYSSPLWGATLRNPAARLEERTIVLDVMTDQLQIAPGEIVPITVQTIVSSLASPADVAEMTATFHAPLRPMLTKFAAIGPSTEVREIAADPFTLPIFNPFGAWNEIQLAWNVSDADVDAVAFYQNYTTDIVYYAGAYSTVGNPGADGVSRRRFYGSEHPRSPALLHMNRIGTAKNTDARSAARVLMHEFGHHWLYSFEISEGGRNSRVLSPAGLHPAQYVDTRAAFRVYDADDASVMGGGYFTDNGNSTFRSSKYSAYAFSWLDLYMMGLASPDEVQPSFYLANSVPALGPAYFPPESQTFRGTRNGVTVDQVLAAMGPRIPSYPWTQRVFRVLFVVVDDPEHPATSDELADVQMYRATFVARFATATGNRAAIVTAWEPPASGKRRSVGTK